MLQHILPATKHLDVNVSHVLLSAVVYCYKNHNGDLLPTQLQQRIKTYEESHGAITVTRIKLALQKDLTGNSTETAKAVQVTDVGLTSGEEEVRRLIPARRARQAVGDPGSSL